MSLRNKIGILALLVLVSGSVWFLCVRSYDVRYRFQSETLPEIVYATLKAWMASSGHEVLSRDPEKLAAKQLIEIEGETYEVDWQVRRTTDSASVVTVSFTSNANMLTNRVGSLFLPTSIKESGGDIVRDFYSVLKDHLAKVKVEVVGEARFETSACICLTIETNQVGKASGMMSYYNTLSGFVLDNELEIAGNPIVNITKWDRETDYLSYDFCYPTHQKNVDLTDGPFYFKTLPEVSAIKARYYGNYITSDRAWYAILDYAKNNNLSIIEKPIEIFYNNPNVDADEKSWLAEIYMPIIQE